MLQPIKPWSIAPPIFAGFALSLWVAHTALAKLEHAEFTQTGWSAKEAVRNDSKPKLHLAIEFLTDDSFHFEYAPAELNTAAQNEIPTSPYIAKTKPGEFYQARFPGPTRSFSAGQELHSATLKVLVDANTLCFEVFSDPISKSANKRITKICPLNLEASWKGLSFTSPNSGPRNWRPKSAVHVYGLGEQFLPQRFGSFDGDWVGQVRYSGSVDDKTGESRNFGNEMVQYPPPANPASRNLGQNGATEKIAGAVGNTEFPIMYAVTDHGLSYSLFLDDIYKQRWDFTTTPWKVETQGAIIRGFLTTGDGLGPLRHAYMDLVGHPLVPPKKAFGLWISEYGFENWQQIDDKIKTLRDHHFPLDGFVLDLQWFGNVRKNSETTRMGTLQFDTTPGHFPEPKAKIASLARNEGVGLIAIEESYIGRGLKEYDDLAKRGYLVKAASGQPLYINENPWWGLGGMIDWSQPAAGAYWHLIKRQPLIELGILGHWTDLGEPEMYRHVENIDGKKQYTTSPREGETHNLYSLFWHESIFSGYAASGTKQRPFLLSRSGGPGMQRFGAAMWSGDIGSKFTDLATHYNVQMNMVLSGLDYFDSDIGGFHREDLDGDLNELYTQWFADACATDVPVRPHTENLDKSRNTSPDRIGDLESNLQNIRRRYELSPYYYSLAHTANQTAEPVIPPIFYYYPTAPDLVMGQEKLIGKMLLATLIAKGGEKLASVYLPPGDWYDYQTLRRYTSPERSSGRVLKNYSLYNDRRFTVPLFARAGAIFPKLLVDDQTMNILGKRADSITHTELTTRVFAGKFPTSFTLFEDDGVTTAYQSGEVATTLISQESDRSSGVVKVSFAPTLGSYTYDDPNSGIKVKAPAQRQYEVELVVPEITDISQVKVLLGDRRLPKRETEELYRSSSSGFFIKAKNLILAKSDRVPSQDQKVFQFFGSASAIK